MDITSVSGASAFQQSKVASSAQYTVAAKVLDSQRQEGAAAIKLLEAATPQASSGGQSGGSLNVLA